MIEYTLMLVVIVSLVIAFTSQVVKPLNVWLNKYMGAYVQCLLEMGELPSIGSEDTTVADEGCNGRFEPGTLANGRPPKGGGAGAGAGNGSGSDGSKNSGSGSDGSGSGGGGSGGTYAGSASRGGSRFINRGRRPSSGVESVGGAAAGKTVEIALDGGGSGSFFKSGSGGGSSVRRQKTRSVAITGMTDMERKKLEKKANGEGKTNIVAGEGIKPPVKKLLVKEPPKQTFEKEEEPFTIGNLIRILFIAAIIIAIVLFVGGQALQMSKSFEK